MAEIRLNKLMRHFNIGLTDLVDFLRSQGVIIDENPCAKVSDRYLPALKKKFGEDYGSELLAQKKKESIDTSIFNEKALKYL